MYCQEFNIGVGSLKWQSTVIVKDENHNKIGSTFSRRAVQLVLQSKARWLDDARTEISLIPIERGGKELNNGFASAIPIVEKRLKTSRKKSIFMDAYRDSEDKILSHSPLEIIKRSKRRTRELHTAFSLALWLGVIIIYFGWNYLTGNTTLTLNPIEWSWNWLLFVVAAFIECGAEIFFCKKELAVLGETIDIRQVNPKNDDMDLRGYEKKLRIKIRIMSSAAVWIPEVMLFFILGYAFNAWDTAWLVFPLALFIELVINFVRKLARNK